MNEILAIGLSFLAGLVVGGLGGIATFSGRISSLETKVKDIAEDIKAIKSSTTCPLHSEMAKNIERLERVNDPRN